MFSIVEAVLPRPLPYRDPSRSVLTFDAPARNKENKFFVPYRDFQEWANKNHSYAAPAAETWIRGPRFLLGRGAPQSILAAPASAGPEDANPWLTIAGVAGNEEQSTPSREMPWAEPPIVYRPLAQQSSVTVDLAVRGASRKPSVAPPSSSRF